MPMNSKKSRRVNKHDQFVVKDVEYKKSSGSDSWDSILNYFYQDSLPKTRTQQKRLRQSANKKTPITHNDSLVWTSKIYIGKFSQMDVVPDIAFDWLMVEGSACSDCEGNKYDISNNLEIGTAS